MDKWKTWTRGFHRKHGILDFKVKSYHVQGVYCSTCVSDKMDGDEGSHGTSDTEYSG